MTVVGLALVDSDPVGIETPVDQLLGAALSHLVSSAGDLTLTTGDVADAICVARKHLATGDEYEHARS